MNKIKGVILLNADIPIREEMFEGRKYLVAPVVALVEGVHAGMAGKHFYSASELAKYAVAWNGVPLPVFHPNENGEFVSANSPEILEQQSVGQLFNARFEEDTRRLVGEVWIDVNKAQSIAPEVLSLIRAGRRLEISTGLYSDDDATPGIWNGEEYDATIMNIRPDHLALLPGGEGACSWEDGCGVRVNVRGTARTPSFSGTETTSWANVTKTFAAYRDAYYRSHGGRPDDIPSTVANAPAAMRNWIASKTLLGEGSADNERDLMFFPVVNPRTGKLNEGALRAVISGRGAQADIPAGAKSSAQKKARNLLNKHFGAELETQSMKKGKTLSEKMQTLAAKIMELGVRCGIVSNEESHEDVRSKLQRAVDILDNEGWMHFVRDVYDDFFVYEARGNNPSEIGIPYVSKLYKRGYTLNEEEEAILAETTEEVREERNYIPVGNAVTAASKEGKANSKENSVMEKKNELIKALIAREDTRFSDEDEKWLKNLEMEQLGKLQVVEPKANADDTSKKEDDTSKDEDTKENASKEDAPKDEGDKPRDNVTMEEYVSKAPPEIRNMLRRAVARDEELKTELVKALLANDRCKFTEEALRGKEIGELEQLAELARVEVDFTGQGGGPQVNVDEDAPPDMLPVFDLTKKAS